MFDHLRLRQWPFVVVPEPKFCTFIADRASFRRDLEKLLGNLSRHNTSTIHPMWSWFGAGKTHTLHYLSNRAAEIHKLGTSHLRTVYTEFPQSPGSFVDVYKSFVHQLDQDTIRDAYEEIYTSPESSSLESDLRAASTDLFSALRVMGIGDSADQSLAMRWLRAENLPVAECRRLGISRRIISSAECSRILIGLIRMFGLSASSQRKTNSRLIWLVDELQRIDRVAPKIRTEINTGLHSTFNACPTGFSMILSFSGQPTETLPAWFSPELKDRIGRTKVMILPPMQTEDGMTFVKDVLEHFRQTDNVDANPFFPFSEASCRAIIEDIQENDELKPRAIMQAFHAVLEEADLEIKDGILSVVSPEFAKKVLAELVQLE